ncbi:unnamed protein product [Sphagnum troendelagicum]
MYWTFGVLNWGLRDLKWGLGGMVWFRFTPQVSSSPSLPPVVVVVVAPMLCRQALAECVATSEKTAQETETGDRASSSRRRNNQFRFQPMRSFRIHSRQRKKTIQQQGGMAVGTLFVTKHPRSQHERH